MNAEERQLITDLFERLRGVGAVDKDRDAEALIISYARQNPDAGYLLVQNVLVQEHLVQQQQMELQSMQARIQDLEAMVAPQQPRAQQPAGGGGFLGGMFGGSRAPAAPASSVPVSRPAPSYTETSSPWGNRSAAPQAGGRYQQPPAYQPPPQQAAPAGGGSFMRSAMGMAAGVAGGMLAANAISNMMKGNSPSGETPAQASGGDLGSNDPGIGDAYNTSGNSGGTYAAEPITDANNDPGTYSETNDSGDSGGETEY